MPDNARAPWEKPYIPPTPADVWQQAAERGHRALSGGETPQDGYDAALEILAGYSQTDDFRGKLNAMLLGTEEWIEALGAKNVVEEFLAALDIAEETAGEALGLIGKFRGVEVKALEDAAKRLDEIVGWLTELVATKRQADPGTAGSG